MSATKDNGGRKIRVTLDLTPEFYSRLNDLEDLVGAESKASVIRQALQLYEYVAKRTVQGWKFRAVSEQGGEEGIVFLGGVPPN